MSALRNAIYSQFRQGGEMSGGGCGMKVLSCSTKYDRSAKSLNSLVKRIKSSYLFLTYVPVG